jgi:hypothetical protein
MAVVPIHPAHLRPGDCLWDDAQVPFTRVTSLPWLEGESVWVATDLLPIEFPPGTTALITSRC